MYVHMVVHANHILYIPKHVVIREMIFGQFLEVHRHHLRRRHVHKIISISKPTTYTAYSAERSHTILLCENVCGGLSVNADAGTASTAAAAAVSLQ